MKEVGNNYITCYRNSQDPLALQQKAPTVYCVRFLDSLSLSPENALLAVFISPKLLWFLANPHQDQFLWKKSTFNQTSKCESIQTFALSSQLLSCAAEVLFSWISHKLSFLLSKAYKLFCCSGKLSESTLHITDLILTEAQWFLVYYYSHFEEEKLSLKLFLWVDDRIRV